MSWIILVVAGLLEVVWAIGLKYTHGFTRLFALPFAHNVASCRVLEKAGYTLEARLRNSAIKDGRICDQLQYAFIAPEIGRQYSASLPQR